MPEGAFGVGNSFEAFTTLVSASQPTHTMQLNLILRGLLVRLSKPAGQCAMLNCSPALLQWSTD